MIGGDIVGKKIGRCALCGKECKLSFEHIPPESAFNSTPVKPVTGETMLQNRDRVPWDITGLPFQNCQKGMGLDSLCENCNNNTGSWYGSAYSMFAKSVAYLTENYLNPNYKSVEIKNLYPLRIIKQVISMFCSINPNANIDDLRQFVLDKEATGIDKKRYKLCMYFTRSNIKRFNEINAIMNIKEKSLSIISEITAYPLGFLLYFDPIENQKFKGVDITVFTDSKYNDVCNIKMPIQYYEINNWLSLDYRTKSEILGIELEPGESK